MIYIVTDPTPRPMAQQMDLLRSTLTMAGVEFITASPSEISNNSTVITDCFVMETPVGNRGHAIATELMTAAQVRNLRLVFYYPSEACATLSASFAPTGQRLAELGLEGYLVKNGNIDVAGYAKVYNLYEYFAWVMINKFNTARLSWVQRLIDTEPKTHRFLFLNGEHRGCRELIFNGVKAAGLLDDCIWSYRGSKGDTGIAPVAEWQDPFVHVDFRFLAFLPEHYYRTKVSVITETSQEEFFPTEKVFKCLMLGHPFILYAGPTALVQLQQMGFQTFAEWIDESYDHVPYPFERADAVIASMRSCPDDIVALSRSVIEHNRQHFFTIAHRAHRTLLDILTDIDHDVIINTNFAVTDVVVAEYFLK